MRFALSLLAALAMATGSAVAADTGFYVGASVGQGSYDISKGEIDEFTEEVIELAVEEEIGYIADWHNASSKLDDSDTVYSFFVGYRFIPYLAAEVAWLELGEAAYKSSGELYIFDPMDKWLLLGEAEPKLTWSGSGAVLSALGIWPVSEQWELFGRVGVLFADTELKFAIDGEKIGSESESSTEFVWGLGVDFIFMDNFAARLEYQMIPDLGDKNTTGEADVDLITLGLIYKF